VAAFRTLLPKQFLPLVTRKTMLQETLLRLGGMARLAGAAGGVQATTIASSPRSSCAKSA